jgi:hypothetical protein
VVLWCLKSSKATLLKEAEVETPNILSLKYCVFTGILVKFVFKVNMITKPNIHYAIIMLLCGILAVGCLKRKEYSTTPQITYKGFQLFQNVAGS